MVVFLFQFIHHGHGIVFYGDETVPLLVHNQVVLPEAELARAHAFLQIAEVGGRGEEHPIEFLFCG